MADCLRIEIELAFWSRIGGLSLDLIREFEFADGDWIGLEYEYLRWIGRMAKNRWIANGLVN